MSGNCPFCGRIERREFDQYDAWSVAFEPLNPVTPGHLLVVPKGHVASAAESPEAAGRAARLAAEIARDMEIGDFNLITSSGAAATQTVRHLHWHIVPRHEDDGLILPWTGQQRRAA